LTSKYMSLFQSNWMGWHNVCISRLSLQQYKLTKNANSRVARRRKRSFHAAHANTNTYLTPPLLYIFNHSNTGWPTGPAAQRESIPSTCTVSTRRTVRCAS
jgi:hypothetical protein